MFLTQTHAQGAQILFQRSDEATTSAGKSDQALFFFLVGNYWLIEMRMMKPLAFLHLL